MTYDDESKTAYSWGSGKLAKLLPEPDAKLVNVSSDDKDIFTASIYNATDDVYKSYIDACKTKGFNKDIYSSSILWEATNKDGIQVSLSYDSDDNEIGISMYSSSN